MKKLLAIAVLLASAISAHAKIGETREQIVRRFGRDAMLAQDAESVTFGRKNFVVVISTRTDAQLSKRIC